MNPPAVELVDVSVGYRGHAVLEHLDLAIAGGRWVALLGPNASGKSTLLRTIAGHLRPLRGTLRIAGLDPFAAPGDRPLQPGCSVDPAELPPFLTIRQCLEIHASAHRLTAIPADVADLASALQLDAHADVLVRHASLGTRQKLAVLLPLMLKPRLLLLDEVFNGLDIASAMLLRSHLRARVEQGGLCILLATHALDIVARCCDELVLLDAGTVAGRWEVRAFDGPDPLAAMEQALAAAPPAARP